MARALSVAPADLRAGEARGPGCAEFSVLAWKSEGGPGAFGTDLHTQFGSKVLTGNAFGARACLRAAHVTFANSATKNNWDP